MEVSYDQLLTGILDHLEWTEMNPSIFVSKLGIFYGVAMENPFRRKALEYVGRGYSRAPGLLEMQGWGNGYVGVQPDHPWFEQSYWDLDEVSIHGGLTYAGETLPQELQVESGLWWVGFDTGHAGDNPERWPKEAVQREVASLMVEAGAALMGVGRREFAVSIHRKLLPPVS